MNDFFKDRVTRHQKMIQRYLKYIFNDHFAFSMMILVGGSALYYSNLLKTLPEKFTPGIFIVLVVWLAALQMGRFASLAKPADMVFLLPKEKQMRDYLAASLKYSCYFPFAVLLLIGGATMPLVAVSTGQSFSMFLLILLSLWSLKVSQLIIQRMALFQEMAKPVKNAQMLWWLLSIVSLGLNLFISPFVGCVLAILQIFLFYNLGWKNMQAALDWEKMIATEQYRLYRLYRFFNLFTDVPEISAQVKRRKGLDWCLNKISYQKDNVYLYLYARRLIRGTEFSSLYLRLTVLGGVLLCFVADRWFALGIGGLFIYLIGFQLLPLYNQFQYVVTTQLYPITTKQKTRAMQQLLRILLAVTFVVFSVIRLFFTHSLEDSLVIVGYLVITLIFLQWYVPYRLKKMAD